MNQQIEYLYSRRVAINYVSPAACEILFSSTAEPVIVLEPFSALGGPTGVILSPFGDGFRLSWDAYPGAICYSVYKAVDELDPYGDYELIAECITDLFLDEVDEDDFYRIEVITPTGTTPLSPPSPPGPPGPPPVDGCEEPDWTSSGVCGETDFLSVSGDEVEYNAAGVGGTGYCVTYNPGNPGEGIPPSVTSELNSDFEGVVGPCVTDKYVTIQGSCRIDSPRVGITGSVGWFSLTVDAVPIFDSGFWALVDIQIPFYYSVLMPAGVTLTVHGAGRWNGAGSGTVSSEFSVTLTDVSPAVPALVPRLIVGPDSGNWTASVVDGTSPTGLVTFYLDGNPQGSAALADMGGGIFQASIPDPGSSAGAHLLTASYAGDGNNAACSSNVYYLWSGIPTPIYYNDQGYRYYYCCNFPFNCSVPTPIVTYICPGMIWSYDSVAACNAYAASYVPSSVSMESVCFPVGVDPTLHTEPLAPEDICISGPTIGPV